MHRNLRRIAYYAERKAFRALVPSWRRHRQWEESVLRHALKSLEVDCVFDVGANSGGYASMLREYCGYRGHIISFEPAPDVFSELKKQAAHDPLWQTLQVALGRSPGTSVFHIHKAREGSSFLPVMPLDASSPGNAIVQDVEVPVTNLSSIFPQMKEKLRFSRPFLKMDTQGYDFEVFSGGLDIMKEFVGLQSELSIVPFYDGAPSWLVSLSAYERAGFALTAIVPNNGSMNLRVREFDCIMTRV